MAVIASDQARQDPAPPALGHCGAVVVGRDGCPATTEILMTKTKARRPATTRQRASKSAATRSVKAKYVGARTKRPTTSKVLPVAKSSALSTSTSGARADSKQARVLALLRSTDGCTIDAVVKATGWQPHSVRGFFAGIVRKKLKLDLDSELVDEVRRYRIKAPADGGSKSAKAT